MYGAYVEVAAYSQVTDLLGNNEISSARPVLSFPEWLFPVPEQRSNLGISVITCEDFVLLSEVCEIEGPRPIFSFPIDVKQKVDIDTLTERILSVDYQCNISGPFVISEDTQVLLSNVWKNFHVYAHYFSLNDICARGFVRPMCIAYISSDKTKLLKNLEELRKNFLEVTKFFKFGNRKLFLQELEQYFEDLQKAKNEYVEKCKSTRNLFYSHSAQCENKTIEDQNARSVTLDVFANSITEVQQLLTADKPLLNDLQFENVLETLVCHIKQDFRNDVYQKVKPFTESRRRKVSKTIEGIKPNRFISEMRNLCELCSWGLVFGLVLVIKIYKFYARVTAVIDLEMQDMLLTEPNVGLMTVGDYVLSNTLSSIGKPTNCIDTKHNKLNYSPEYYIQSVYQHIQDLRSLLEHLLTASSKRSKNSSNVSSTDDKFNELNSEYSNTISINLESSFIHQISNSPNSENHDFMSASCSLNDSSSECSESEEDKYEDAFETPLDNTTKKSYNHVKSLASHIDRITAERPGYGIAKIFHQFPCMPHLLYSLLISRPVLIIGSIALQETVRSVVQAVSIFIPGNQRVGNIIPWTNLPVKFSDISQSKLFGVGIPEKKSLEEMISDNVKNHVTLLDVEKKTFYGPIYTGKLIEPLKRLQKYNTDDNVLIILAFTYLLIISNKIKMNFQYVCLNEKVNESDTKTLKFWKKTPEVLLKGLKLKNSDIIIVKHLTETLKARHSQMTENQQNFDLMPGTVPQLSHEKLSVLKM